MPRDDSETVDGVVQPDSKSSTNTHDVVRRRVPRRVCCGWTDVDRRPSCSMHGECSGRSHVATAMAHACATRGARNQATLAPTPDKPLGPVTRRSPPRPAATTGAATNPHLTGRRPDNRSPTEHVADDTSVVARLSLHETPHNLFPGQPPQVARVSPIDPVKPALETKPPSKPSGRTESALEATS